MKPVEWLGDSKKVVQAFPEDVRGVVGYELEKVQLGLRPRDAKPMPSIGVGVEEIEYGTSRERIA